MREKVLRTLAYFDIFDYPLTYFELWKFLISSQPESWKNVYDQSDLLIVEGKIERKNGFLFLSGRADIVEKRIGRYLIAEKKYKRAVWATKFLRFIPSIRLVAVCNTLAWSHSADSSDIDLFIVSSLGSVWTTRLLTILPFKIFGMRTGPNSKSDMFCFSFFASESALNFNQINIANDDPYLNFWLSSLVPIYDPDDTLSVIGELNSSLQKNLPNTKPVVTSYRRRVNSLANKNNNFGFSKKWFESFARALQLIFLPEKIRSAMNLDTRVIVTDDMLKFHSNDRREEFRQLFFDRCNTLGV